MGSPGTVRGFCGSANVMRRRMLFRIRATKKPLDPLVGRFMALIYGGSIRAGVPINKKNLFCIFSLVEMGGNVNGKREIPGGIISSKVAFMGGNFLN